MNNSFQIAQHDATLIYDIDSDGNYWEAKVSNGDCGSSTQESHEKLARLLAAAPMLYEALESFVRIFEGATMDKRDMLMYPAYNAAKAALAAAK